MPPRVPLPIRESPRASGSRRRAEVASSGSDDGSGSGSGSGSRAGCARTGQRARDATAVCVVAARGAGAGLADSCAHAHPRRGVRVAARVAGLRWRRCPTAGVHRDLVRVRAGDGVRPGRLGVRGRQLHAGVRDGVDLHRHLRRLVQRRLHQRRDLRDDRRRQQQHLVRQRVDLRDPLRRLVLDVVRRRRYLQARVRHRRAAAGHRDRQLPVGRVQRSSVFRSSTGRRAGSLASWWEARRGPGPAEGGAATHLLELSASRRTAGRAARATSAPRRGRWRGPARRPAG